MKSVKLIMGEDILELEKVKNVVERTSNTSDVLFISISAEEDPENPVDVLGLKSQLENSPNVDIEITYEDGSQKTISRVPKEVNVIRSFDFSDHTEARITF
jgi:hypothetical protein